MIFAVRNNQVRHSNETSAKVQVRLRSKEESHFFAQNLPKKMLRVVIAWLLCMAESLSSLSNSWWFSLMYLEARNVVEKYESYVSSFSDELVTKHH